MVFILVSYVTEKKTYNKCAVIWKREWCPFFWYEIIKVYNFDETFGVTTVNLIKRWTVAGFSAITGRFQILVFFSKISYMRPTFLHTSMFGRTCALKWYTTKPLSRGSVNHNFAKCYMIQHSSLCCHNITCRVAAISVRFQARHVCNFHGCGLKFNSYYQFKLHKVC